jgi:hypothetical protein
MKIAAAFKNKKYRWLIWGGLAVIGVIVLMAMMRGGGGATRTVQSGPSEALLAAQLQSQTALQGAQIQAGVALAQTQAGVAVETMRMQVQQEEIGASLQALSIQQNTMLQVEDLRSSDALTATLAGMETQGLLAQFQKDIQLAGIGAQRDVAIAAEQSALFRDQLIAETMVAQGAQQAHVSMAQIAATQNLGIANIQATQNLGIAHIDATTDQAALNARTQLGMASIAADSQRYSTDAQIEMKQIEASTQKSGQKKSFLSSVIGGALSVVPFLSDYRVKSDIKQIGERRDGTPIYQFNYDPSVGGGRMIGVMAQDIGSRYPHLMLQSGGYHMVDYAGLESGSRMAL